MIEEKIKPAIAILFALLVISALTGIVSYHTGYDNGFASKNCYEENATETCAVIDADTYWKHVPLPIEAKKLLNDTKCYHADCFEVRENNTLCYIEIGKYYGNGSDSTCYIGDGNLVVID